MRNWIPLLILSVLSQTISSQICPSDHISAVFTAILNQSVDDPVLTVDDPELTFFTTVLQFREATIQHVIDDAVKFFNDSYGLDFSDSTPNAQKERFFQNAKMNSFIFPPGKFNYFVTDNYWIRNGHTSSTCYSLVDGGFQVTFSGEQILYGSYGGAEGKAVGTESLVVYGFYKMDRCKQSPVIIQYQTGAPIRGENVDGHIVSITSLKLYNRVLGHGETLGILWVGPDPDEPGRFRVIVRNTFVFPSP